MKRIIVLAMVFVFGFGLSCNKKPTDIVCKSVFRATVGVANTLSTVLECKNPGAIAADLSNQILKIGLCTETQMQSTLSDFVCPQISTLVSTTISSTVPANWECSVTTISDIIKSKVSDTCVKIVK